MTADADIERAQALWIALDRWLGTPFSANGNTPGLRGGVSCQFFAAALLRDAGSVDVSPDVPPGPMQRGRFARASLIEAWLDARPEFRRLTPLNWEVVRPGDLLGFQLGGCVQHLGVALGGGQFAHALEGIGVTVSEASDPTWRKRLRAGWRTSN